MALSDDLVAQARRLALTDPGRPKQTSLRRAVSTAYYGLFHELVSTSARFLVSGRGRRSLRDVLCREFEHNVMRAAARAFLSRASNSWVELLQGPPSIELEQVADALVDLQELRHRADYDVAARFDRTRTLAVVNKADSALHTMRRIAGTHEAECFLLALQFRGRRGA
jgi:uncharacterized protein (UPF0332 family)